MSKIRTRKAKSSPRQKEVHDLMKRLGYDPNDEGAFIGVEQGLEGGFPHCCIAFFVLIWHWAALAERPTKECLWRITGDYRRLLDVARERGQLQHEDGYIPCPSCLLKLTQKSDAQQHGKPRGPKPT